MKFSELQEPQLGQSVAHIKEMQEWVSRELRETRERIVGYLFGLNAGGLVADAAFLSQKAGNCLVKYSVVLFGVGLFVTVIRAAIDYYGCEAIARSLNGDVRKFYTDEIDSEQFWTRKGVKFHDWPLHCLGIAAGVCFFAGLIVGFIGMIQG